MENKVVKTRILAQSLLAIEKVRPFYPINDPVHGFDHVLRVVRLAEHLAGLEAADPEIVCAAALLHDGRIQAPPGDPGSASRLDHHEQSAELAGRFLESEGWPPVRIQAVQHCIRAHRFRDDSTLPETIEARVVFDADKLDAIGAVGAARAIAFAVQAGKPLFAQPSEVFLRDGILEPGEPHSAYHEFIFKLVKIKSRLLTESGKRLAEKRHECMLSFFETLARESSDESAISVTE